MSGPAKTPTEILEARGSWKVRERKNEPKVPKGMPAMPKWISKGGKKQWVILTAQLMQLGVLTGIDGTSLALLCDAIGMYIECKKDLETRGLLIPGRDDTKVKNPSYQFMNEAFEKIHKLSKEFGLTPSSRAGLSVAPTEETTDETRFFNS